MANPREYPGWGTWLLFIAAALAVLASLYAFLIAWGINHSVGSGIVLVSTIIMALATLALALWPAMPKWLRIVLLIGLALDLIGTGVAAYFLAAWVLFALMIIGAIGWLAAVFIGFTPTREQSA